jgi:hypothetical protein
MCYPDRKSNLNKKEDKSKAKRCKGAGEEKRENGKRLRLRLRKCTGFRLKTMTDEGS